MEFDFDIFCICMCEFVFLNCGLMILIEDKCEEYKVCKDFYYEGGICFYVEYLNKVKDVIYELLIYLEGECDDIMVEIFM